MRLLSDANPNKKVRPAEGMNPAAFIEWLHICEAMAWTIEHEAPETQLVSYDEP